MTLAGFFSSVGRDKKVVNRGMDNQQAELHVRDIFV